MRWMRSAGRLGLVLAVSGLMLASPASSDAATSATAASQTSGCEAPWGSQPKSQATDEYSQDHLVNVRSGRHDCYDRLVIDFDGAAPGFEVKYVDEVTQDGSGNVVSLRGGAFLSVRVLAPAYDENGASTYDPANRDELVAVGSYDTFRQVAFASSFEGQTVLGLGVRARLPFRVFTLDGSGDSSRLVIDVAHNWYSAAPSGKTVQVYYPTGDGTDCAEVTGYARDATGVRAVVGHSLDQLVVGPTASEKADGASSMFSADTAGAVRSVKLSGGLLTVDFNDITGDLPNASTSCGSAALLAQLNATVFQFPAVQRVRYQINGSCDAFYQWLQGSCTEIARP